MIRLFTSSPDAAQPQACAAHLRRVSGQPVQVLPLSALEPPTAKLRHELQEAENRLAQIELLLSVGTKHAPTYDGQLPRLRRDRERHQQLILELKRRLGEEGGEQS